MRTLLANFLKTLQPNVKPLFALDGLSRLENHKGYGTAEPYPHLILDNLFNPQALNAVLREWPFQDKGIVDEYDDGKFVKKKFATNWKTPLGKSTRQYFTQLSHPSFLQVLEKVTGIGRLLPDPYMFGGGLHATATGGNLAVHVDYNKHPVFKLDRRINVLVFLNKGWTEANAGWLELWNHANKQCVKRVLPIFNRTVIFSTTSTSYHGQPEPVAGPPDLWRKSIALYYFSNGRPEEGPTQSDPQEHSTLWMDAEKQ